MKTFTLLLTLTLGCTVGSFAQNEPISLSSGGPLLNDQGELVGVVNAKVVAKGVEGIGFAIPLHELLPGLWLTR